MERWRMLLEPFAMMLAGIDARLTTLGEKDLSELRDACDRVTTTNCWHFTYDAARLLIPMIEAAARVRSSSRPQGGDR